MKPPGRLDWYPYFPSHMTEATQDWTAEELGGYQRLLNYQWANGRLPRDPRRLRRIVGELNAPFEEFWAVVGKKFVDNGEGLENERMASDRIEAERKVAFYHERARAGAAARWGGNATSNASSIDDASSTDQAMPRASRSSSSSSSSVKPPEQESTTTGSGTTGTEGGKNHQRERVGRVLEIFPEVAPGRAASWLKKWDGKDRAMLQALAEIRSLYPDEGVNYIGQVLESTRRRGGKVRVSPVPKSKRHRTSESPAGGWGVETRKE